MGPSKWQQTGIVSLEEKMKAPQRYSVIAVAGLMVVATICLCLFWRVRHTTLPLTVTLPEENEIERITAMIDYQGHSTPTFVISPEHYTLVLSALAPTETYEYPTSWEDMTVGRVEILTKAGKRLTIKFCEAGVNKLHFSVDGIRCKRGGEYKPVVVGDDLTMFVDESMVFLNILRGIHQKTTTGEESDEFTRAVQMLERSKGERPPKRK